MEFAIPVGTEGSKTVTVKPNNMATAYGSGLVEVFATPAMIALMEQAASESVQSLLPDGYVTVGYEVHVKHLKASYAGETISAKAKLIQSEGRKLTFEVEACGDNELIGKGSHIRYIVDKQKFIK